MGAPTTAPSRTTAAGRSVSSTPRSSFRDSLSSESNEALSGRTLQVPCRLRWIAPATRARCSPEAGTTSSIKRRPGGPGWEFELLNRLGSHGHAPSGQLWRHVAAVADHHRVEEVLVEVLDVFEDTVLERSAYGDVVEK